MNYKLTNLSKDSLIKKIVALLLIIVLTMFDFILLGNEMISYAADILNEGTATNNKNVTFDAYFKDSNGTIYTEKEEKIDSNDIKLFVRVSVKNDGYFNGQVSLESGNFSFKNEVLNSAINKIEGNTITLNQINSGEISEFAIGIEPNTEDTISSGLLSMSSVLSINGIYRNEKEKDIKITDKREVKLSLSNPYEDNKGMVLNGTIITNKIYEVNNRAKRIVQVLVENGLEGNKYPIKDSKIELSVPDKAEEVKVNARGTLFSNGKYETDFNENNWNYNEEEHKVLISIKNEEENGSIKWLKNGKDTFVVTYVMDDGTEINDTNISIKSDITMYDTKATVKEATIDVKVNEEKDGIITTGIDPVEKSIYKGNIYSGIDREYKIKSNIYVNNSQTETVANVELLPSKYELSEGEMVANSQISNTVINKDNVIRILGEDGVLKILALDDQVISEVSKDTETDENGNILINYPEGTSAIKIVTTKPKSEGTIVLNNTKVIKQDGNARNVKESYLALKESMTNAEAKIELKDTESKAKLQINRTSLSTLTENVGVEITGTLITNNEACDLYANPSLKFVLPSQVENVTNFSANLIYEDELQIASSSVIDENGNKVIIVNLAGQQTKYKEGNVEGATIIVKANMALNKKATNSNESIKMSYTNPNTGDNLEVNQPIDVVSPRGMVTINSINDYGMSVIGEEETKTSKLELGAEARESLVNIEIINNNEENIKDVKVLGEFPTQNATNTIKAKVGALEVSDSSAEVYYTEKEDATEDLNDSSNGWSKELTDSESVKKYLIKVDSMEQSQDLTASYKLNIPEGLQYNEQAYEGYKVKYSNENTTSEVAATKLGLSTGKGPELKASMKAKLGNQDITDGGKIAQGEVVKYEIEIENTGSETATAVKVSSLVPEGTVYVEPKENYVYEDGYYNELTDKKEATFDIEKIDAGQKITKSFEVKVTKDAQIDSELENKAIVKYGEATTESEIAKVKVTSGDINVMVKRATDLSIENFRGEYIDYFVAVKNISEKTLKDVDVMINLPEEIKINKMFIIDQEEEDIEIANPVRIEKIEAGDTMHIHIVTELQGLENIDEKEVSISATAKAKDSNEAKSNEIIENLKDFKLLISLSANNENGYLKTGDTIEYTIKIQNSSSINSTDVDISDVIPEELSVQSITIGGEEKTDVDNNVSFVRSIPANSSLEAKIKTIVNYDESRKDTVVISNIANVLEGEKVLSTSGEVTHILQAEEIEGEEDNPDKKEDTYKGLISGTAWLDENQNGQRDEDEQLLDGIKVRLIDTAGNTVKTDNAEEITAITNNKGFYILNNIPKGEYLVIFDYDTSTYATTAYKKAGISESKNSDAIVKQLVVNGEQRNYGVTDTISINENGVTNIDLGLMTATKFDLELNKYISKIIVQTKKETKTYSYDKATLAKAEIAAKQLQGSTVIIEYQIEVKNVGEVPGYVKNIVDYMPSSLKFSSELNSDWYQSGTDLYNTSLANTRLEAGETRTIPLTLTKAMTEENTGLVNNKAEIAESYNESGIKDIDSTAGNKVQKEDDMGSADVIIGVKTGAMVTYLGLTISVIMLIGIGAFYLKKKWDNENNIEVNF